VKVMPDAYAGVIEERPETDVRDDLPAPAYADAAADAEGRGVVSTDD